MTGNINSNAITVNMYKNLEICIIEIINYSKIDIETQSTI